MLHSSLQTDVLQQANEEALTPNGLSPDVVCALNFSTQRQSRI